MTQDNINTFSAMQTGKPYSTYQKTILGKVYVEAIDPFTEKPTGVLLYGDPRKNEESSIIDIWSERDDVFFKRANKVHFKNGIIISHTRKENEPVVAPIEQYTDEQLKEIINSKFLSLQSKLNKTESEVVIYRMLTLAKEMDKSNAIVNAIRARLTEVSKLPISE